MKKLLLFITLIAAPILFTACDEDEPRHDGWLDDGWNNGGYDNGGYNNGGSESLTSEELALVGSYVSNDGNEPVIYLTLNQDRSGYETDVENGTSTTTNFTWYMQNSQIYFYYSSASNDYKAYSCYTQDGVLYINNVPMVKNNGGNSGNSGTTTTTSPLIGQWQGTITNYYLAEYPTLDSTGTYATIIEYANDGTGAQLDYEVTNPQGNYSYMPFSWTNLNSSIVMSFGSDIPTTTISNYVLTTTQLSGQMVIGRDAYPFVFAKTSGFDWSSYTNETRSAAAVKQTAKSLLRELKAKKAKRTATGRFAK